LRGVALLCVACGVATIAEKLADLRTELAAIKAAMLGMYSGGQSFTIGDMTVQNANMAALQDRRNQVERSIQRLLRGGRGMQVDMGVTPQ
jgi:hypothetical protein